MCAPEIDIDREMPQIDVCIEECPIVNGLSEEKKKILLSRCASLCIGAREGQYGFMICGTPTGTDKNEMTRNSLSLVALSRIEEANTV